MNHIWNAIDLCQRKLLNERERLESETIEELHIGQSSRPGAAATIDKTRDQLDEVEGELRAVTAARRDFRDLYGEPGD